MNRTLAVSLLALAAAGICEAHQDRGLTVTDNGTILELPAEFGPASVKIEFAQSPPIASITLRLGKNIVKVPKCATGFLTSRSMKDVAVAASWYHEESVIPYYLSMHFFDPAHNSNGWSNPYYLLIFNLRTARLLSMDAHVVMDEGKTFQDLPLDLAFSCSAEDLKHLK